MKALIAITMVLALVTGGCGSDPEPQRSASIDSNQNQGTPEKESPTPPEQNPAPKNIEEALLTLDEMPVGYSSEGRLSDPGIFVDLCGNPIPTDTEALDFAGAGFTADPSYGPIIAHAIFRHESGEAEVRMNQILEAEEACSKGREGKFMITVEGLAFGKVGEASAASRTIRKDQYSVQISDSVQWVRGDIRVSVQYSSLGSPNILELKKYVRKADAKIVELMES
jgi:hypothetical protein